MNGRSLLRLALIVIMLMEVMLPAQGLPAERKLGAHPRGRILTCPDAPRAPRKPPLRPSRHCAQQARTFFEREQSGWRIHFQAFFRTPLPSTRLGVVVLSESENPVGMLRLRGKKGQTRLSSTIEIFYTDTPERPHTIQVYYLKKGEAMILASEVIVLSKAQDPKLTASRSE